MAGPPGEDRFFHRLSTWFKERIGHRNARFYYAGAILIVGVILMLISTSNEPPPEQENSLPPPEPDNEETSPVLAEESKQESKDYEEIYEQALRTHLNQISGVSDVDVFVTVASSEERVFEKDRNARHQHTEETDHEGGSRELEEGTAEEQIVMKRSGEEERPILVRTDRPQVTGVLVTANGVEQLKKKEWVMEAVTRVLDVPAHRVSVLPKSEGGED
ncbi:stage III sporulation protein AG [Salsuginibacillus kocurii]|uniref:stage III sporulation protein AG n=1 Tax=Salsuginibacillus kocurii TaxID=427078 RepID=UPI00035C51BE|nr:stage III sporulation protein AG [Salsuginibacillus kocurii]